MMAQLMEPVFLNTVVALGRPTESGTVQYTATGFLYSYPTSLNSNDGQQLYMTCLVTNRHVVEDATELVSRFNRPMNLASQTFPIPLRRSDDTPRWTMHPNGVDVAVIPISTEVLGKHGIEFAVFQNDMHTLTRQQALSSGISEGDGVFILGFPLGEAGEERNYAIVRQGIIARIQDWLRGEVSQFLVDAAVYPGNSGGPVLTKPEVAHITNTQNYMKSSLIGMVSSYLPYREVAISQQTGRPRMIFEENSGLGQVVPIDAIQETIQLALGKGRIAE